jgi:hypothetical protein
MVIHGDKQEIDSKDPPNPTSPQRDRDPNPVVLPTAVRKLQPEEKERSSLLLANTNIALGCKPSRPSFMTLVASWK